MSTATLGPLDETITVADLTRDPYPIYKRLRREAPVLRVKSVGRTFLTKAADTKRGVVQLQRSEHAHEACLSRAYADAQGPRRASD